MYFSDFIDLPSFALHAQWVVPQASGTTQVILWSETFYRVPLTRLGKVFFCFKDWLNLKLYFTMIRERDPFAFFM